MATRTISNAGGSWNTVGAWVEGAVPLSNDDVVATATSGNLTINATAVCRSIDLTSYAGTLVQNAVSLTIGDGSGGALKFVAGMTFTRSVSGSFVFASTSNNSGAGWSVDFAGKTLSPVTFNGAGGKWVLQTDLVMTGVALSLLAGTLDTNSKNISISNFSSNTGTRTLTPGSSTITLTGSVATIWNITASATMTITANTATVVLTPSTSAITVLGGLVDHNGMSFSMTTAGTLTIGSAAGSSGFSIANLTRTGTATSGDGLVFSEVMTITGTLSLNGNSVINRLLVSSIAVGTPVVITCNTTVTGQYVDIRDITAAGTGSWNLSSITGGSGDLWGNTGITLTTPANQYWIAHTGTWGVSANWGTTSGGTGGRVPLPQDTAIFDANSFSAGGQTVTISGPFRLSAINSSAATNSPTFTSASTAITVYGSLEWTNVLFSTMGFLTLAGRGSHNFKVTSYISTITFITVIGTYTSTANSDLTSSFTVTSGSFNTANFNLTASIFSFSSVSTINLGSSTLTTTALSTTVFTANPTTILSASNASITITGKSGSTRTFAGGGLTYGTLTYSVTDSIGALTITGNNIFESIVLGPGTQLNQGATVVQAINNPQFNGSDLGYVYIAGQYFVTPDHSDFDITGDLDFIVNIRADDWTPASVSVLISRNDSSNLSYQFSLNTTGSLILSLSTNGTSFVNTASSTTLAAAIGIVDGTDKWVRVTRRQSDGRIQFFYSNDGSSWTQLGTNQTGTTSALFAGTSQVSLGGTVLALNLFSGRLYRAIIKNGIDGTIVADLDTSNWVPLTTTMNDSAGKAWTYTTSAGTNAVGDGRVKLFGGDVATYLYDPPTSATLAYPQNKWQQSDWTDATTYLGYISATTTEYLFCESQASLLITGDLDVIARIQMTDWTPFARQYIASKAGTPSTSTDISWRFSVESNGSLRFVYTSDGTTQRTATSSILNTLTNGTDKWVRVTYESATGFVKFYLGDDGTTWIQFGTTQTITAGSIYSSTSRLRVGHGDSTTTGALVGRIYQFTMKSGIDGTTVAHFDYAVRTTKSFVFLELSGSDGTGGGFWVADQGLDDGSNNGWSFASIVIVAITGFSAPAFVYVPDVSGGVGSEVVFVQRASVLSRLTVVVRESVVGINSSSPIPLRSSARSIGVNTNPVSGTSNPPN